MFLFLCLCHISIVLFSEFHIFVGENFSFFFLFQLKYFFEVTHREKLCFTEFSTWIH